MTGEGTGTAWAADLDTLCSAGPHSACQGRGTLARVLPLSRDRLLPSSQAVSSTLCPIQSTSCPDLCQVCSTGKFPTLVPRRKAPGQGLQSREGIKHNELNHPQMLVGGGIWTPNSQRGWVSACTHRHLTWGASGGSVTSTRPMRFRRGSQLRVETRLGMEKDEQRCKGSAEALSSVPRMGLEGTGQVRLLCCLGMLWFGTGRGAHTCSTPLPG